MGADQSTWRRTPCPFTGSESSGTARALGGKGPYPQGQLVPPPWLKLRRRWNLTPHQSQPNSEAHRTGGLEVLKPRFPPPVKMFENLCQVQETRHKRPRIACVRSYRTSGMGKSLETERRATVTGDRRKGETGSQGCRSWVPLGLKTHGNWTLVTVAPLCTHRHPAVHSDLVVCELTSQADISTGGQAGKQSSHVTVPSRQRRTRPT